MSSHKCSVLIYFFMSKANGFNAELFFSALADRTRLRLINLLRDGEVCVCFLPAHWRQTILRSLATLPTSSVLPWSPHAATANGCITALDARQTQQPPR